MPRKEARVGLAEACLAETWADQAKEGSCPFEALSRLVHARLEIRVRLKSRSRVPELLARNAAHALGQRLLQLQSVRHKGPYL